MQKSKFLMICLILIIAILSISILVACDKDNDGNTNGKTPPYSGGKLLNGTFDGMVIKNGILTEYNGLATELVIPSGVTSIGNGAFLGCSGLTSVTIGSGVTSIGNYAFWGCDKIQNVTTPMELLSGFDKTKLENVTITKGEIPNNAFINCTNLTTVTLKDSVTSIGGSAFNGCSGLTSITIPDSVTSMGNYAFRGCSKLTINVRAASKPSDWHNDWNPDGRPVNWAYKG